MSKYKIQVVESLPNDEKIQQYQDFPRLYRRFRYITRFNFWKKLYKNPLSFASVVLISSIAYLVFQADVEENAEDKTNHSQVEAPHLPEKEKTSFSTSQDSTQHHRNDSIISEPPRDK